MCYHELQKKKKKKKKKMMMILFFTIHVQTNIYSNMWQIQC